MSEDRYRKLADHLDQLPGGFAPSDTGADLRVLKRLFTPEEAELARHLTLDREEAQRIATRAGMPLSETAHRLAEMARKGLIFSCHPKDGSPLYQAIPFIVGIYEFQVNNLTQEFLQDLAEYWRTAQPRSRPSTIPQMRTIPVGQSLEPHLEALPYEQVEALIAPHHHFAVGPCICRRKATVTGSGCDAPEESCLTFGEWAEFAVHNGLGRFIDRSEVTEILDRADAANLVLQPNNSQNIAFLCCCCGCCCGVLQGLQRHPKPAEIVASAFMARFQSDLCQECGVCVERCQMQALTEAHDHLALNPDRCIGCGLCVTTCPSGALTLTRKPPAKAPSHIPVDMTATWRTIAQAQTAARNVMP